MYRPFSMQRLLSLNGIELRIDGATVLDGVDWQVDAGQQWVVIGPNGGGKSSLVAIAGLHRHPTSGTIDLLGHRLGRVDIRPLRGRVGTSSAILADQLRGQLRADDVVRCGRFGALEPWWHTYERSDTERAHALLAQVGLAGFTDHSFASLSSGERQRCLLARALMPEPDVLLLDEPTAGLDLAGREQLVGALVELASRDDAPVTALVTHHVEDIPPTTTHVLAIAGGRSVAQGPIDATLTGDLLSELFAMRVELTRIDNRWSARSRTGTG